MNNKFLMVLSLIVIIFLISGCRTPRGVEKPMRYQYRTGSEGLVLNFPTNGFTRLYENEDDVRMTVEIRNRGAFPQPEETGEFYGYIWVGGFDKSILELEPDADNNRLDAVSLEGKSPINMEGGREAVVFVGDIYNLPGGVPYYRTPIIATTTYFYKTVAAPTVCVDPYPRSAEVREKVCRIREYGSIAISGSQGAPVAITTIEEDATSDYLLFRIHMQNVGGGLVIPIGDIHEDPNLGYDWDELNRVEIGDVSVGNIPMDDCRPDDFIKLENNRGYMLCRIRTTTLGANTYNAPLNIELEYGYSSSVRKEIEIVKEVQFGR